MNFIEKIRQDYQETSMPYEDFLEWYVKKRLSWQSRWLLVIVIVIGFHFFLLNPLHFLYLFYLLLCFFLFSLCVFLVGVVKDIIKALWKG